MSDGPARPPVPSADQPPAAARGYRAGGPAGKFPPPQDPFLGPDEAPFVPEAAPAAPGPTRPSRVLGPLPVWGLVALGLVVIIAGVLFVPSVMPWSRAPVESPLDDPDPELEIGVVGNPTPQTVTVGASATPSATAEPTAGADPSGGPAAPGAPTPTSAPTDSSPGPSDGLEIVFYTAAPLPNNEGSRVTVHIANRRTVPQFWQNVAVEILDWPPQPLVVEEPAAGVQAFSAQSRVCLRPIDPLVGRIEAGQSLTIVFRMNARISNSLRAVRLNEPTSCLLAES